MLRLAIPASEEHAMTVHDSWTLEALVEAYRQHQQRVRGLRQPTLRDYELRAVCALVPTILPRRGSAGAHATDACQGSAVRHVADQRTEANTGAAGEETSTAELLECRSRTRTRVWDSNW